MKQVTAADDELGQTQREELDGLDAEVVAPTGDADAEVAQPSNNADADFAAQVAASEVRSIAKCFAPVLLQCGVLGTVSHASMAAQS